MNIVLFQPCGEGTENRIVVEHCSICSLSRPVKNGAFLGWSVLGFITSVSSPQIRF